jgi:lipid-binding SYLF domain-containing protein
MKHLRNHSMARLSIAFAVVVVSLLAFGCSTAPKAEDQTTFASDARTATLWFEQNVRGLREQVDGAAAYIIYPSVGQWGILIGGGQFGRGMLNRADDSQIGWAAINTGSIGLQAGVRGFKMLVVLEDTATLNRFMENKLSGSVSGIVVVGEAGQSARAPFENGVAVYQGASTGLMAGVNIGLDYMRYEPM